MKGLSVYLISDSTGETASQITSTIIQQYTNDYKILKFPFIDNTEKLTQCLAEITGEQVVVVASVANPELTQIIKDWGNRKQIAVIDLISSVLNAMGNRRFLIPGLNCPLDRDYFNRVEAIEFAVRYDDGKDPIGILMADIVLIGISRTSKTPLSMYLANQGYKVVNIPIIQDLDLPKEIYKIPREKIFGLTNNPEKIYEIRLERLKTLGLDHEPNYASLEKILQEIHYAEDLMHKLGCPIINVSNKAIEETADLILRIYQEK